MGTSSSEGGNDDAASETDGVVVADRVVAAGDGPVKKAKQTKGSQKNKRARKKKVSDTVSFTIPSLTGHTLSRFQRQ